MRKKETADGVQPMKSLWVRNVIIPTIYYFGFVEDVLAKSIGLGIGWTLYPYQKTSSEYRVQSSELKEDVGKEEKRFIPDAVLKNYS